MLKSKLSILLTLPSRFDLCYKYWKLPNLQYIMDQQKHICHSFLTLYFIKIMFYSKSLVFTTYSHNNINMVPDKNA